MLAQGPLLQGLSRKFFKAVFLVALAPGDQAPYKGEPSWGVRLSYLASEQYRTKSTGAPLACISIAAEGQSQGRDACANFPGQRSISEADKKNADMLRSEISIFGVPRTEELHSNGCKTGESEAESLGCN